MRRPYEIVKRCLDVVLIALSLLLLLPLLLLISAAVLIDSGWPIFYVQPRVGRYGKPFPFFKFRTMVTNADSLGLGYNVVADDARITKVGHFLRRWHLDELPQLLNVLRGEMSLVGPRPTLQYQVDTYTPRQMGRLDVLPGLTGLAQVSGLNALTWPEKIEIDLEYVERASLWLDLSIMLKTFGVVLDGEGVYGAGWQGNGAADPAREAPSDDREAHG